MLFMEVCMVRISLGKLAERQNSKYKAEFLAGLYTSRFVLNFQGVTVNQSQ